MRRNLINKILAGLLVLFLTTIPTNVRANDNAFISLDWSSLLSGTELPVYSCIREVGSDYACKNYKVAIEYPEYTTLTKGEIELLKKRGLKRITTDTLSIEQSLQVSRKKGFLEIAFIPIIHKHGTYYRLSNFKLTVYENPKSDIRLLAKSLNLINTQASTTTPYAQQSVLSDGKWVKIAVPQEGVYQLTSAALASMGFKDPTRVKLYGYGGLMQDSVINYTGTHADVDDLREVPLYRSSNGKLLFYANGVTRWLYVNGIWRHRNNPYSALSYYFLTEGDNPLPLEKEETTSNSFGARDIVPGHALYEEDAYSWYTGGQQFFDSYDFAYGNTKTYTVKTPNKSNTGTAYATIVFTASDNASTQVTTDLNGKSLGSMTIPLLNNTNAGEQGYKARIKEATYTTDALNEENNTFRFTTTSGHAARLDYIRVTYPMTLNLSNGYLAFSDPGKSGGGNYTIHSAGNGTQVWHIGTGSQETKEVPGSLNGSDYNVTLPNVGDLYVAVNTEATFPSPTYVGSIENQNLHADNNYDMVIIVPESGKLLTQAKRLADFHAQHDKMRVRVVRADQIYNEFSSGTPDAMAYRRYLKMLYDRADSEENMPRHLLLMGDAAWDNRMITTPWKAYNPKDYLLCYESWNSINEIDCYVTDDFFGLLDDGEGKNLLSEKIDLSIGRFPVTTAEEAKIMVDKVIAYAENKNAGVWKNRICIMGDDEKNNNSLMADAEEVASRIETKYPDYNIKRVYWDAYDRESSSTGNRYPQITELLRNLTKQGTLIMNYTGHGSPTQISHEKALTLSDFKEIKTNKLPLWISASCEMTPFDSQEETIGETAVTNPNGGAIAFLSATRSVYSTRNKYLNKFYMDYVLGTDENGKRYSIGEALMKSKVMLVSTKTGADRAMSDYTINKLKYNIMGDPALVLPTPTQRIVIDSIDGQKLGDGNIALSAGKVVRINGHLETPDGQLLNQFDGSVTASIYDRKETITCKNNANTNIAAFKYQDRTKKLFEGSNTVKGGTFSLEFPVSLDVNYSEATGLISLYAVDNTDSLEANGTTDKFYINTSETADADTLGPRLYVYLNNPEFEDGGKVNTTPYFVAQIEDKDGINATGSGVGHDLELIIDGDAANAYVLNDYFTNEFGTYTKGTVRYALPELQPGVHRLAFRAWDMQNNSSTAVLNFKVSTDSRPRILDVYCSDNPATTQTTFTVSYDRPETDVTIQIDIYDCLGQHVWEKTISGQSSDGYYPVSWDLTNGKGARLSGGVYLYKVSVRSAAGGKASTQTKKLIILNNK